MKPFNLKEAKEGKPVCTRDGRKVRIICFDLQNKRYPIAAAIEEKGLEENYEEVSTFTLEGKYQANEDSYRDLFMDTEKKTGWINIYKNDKEAATGVTVYKDKETAEKFAGKINFITTVQITWEE